MFLVKKSEHDFARTDRVGGQINLKTVRTFPPLEKSGRDKEAESVNIYKYSWRIAP